MNTLKDFQPDQTLIEMRVQPVWLIYITDTDSAADSQPITVLGSWNDKYNNVAI